MYFQVVGTNIRILGSMHGFPTGTVGMPKFVIDAYQWSKVIIAEHDGSELLPYFKIGESELPIKVCSQDTWRKINDFWPDHELFNPIERIHPWALFILASAFNMEFLPGVEEYIRVKSIEDGKPFNFLETTQDAIASLQTAPFDEIELALDFLVKDHTWQNANLQEIYEAWVRKDLAAAYIAAAKSPSFTYPGMRDAFFINRNWQWAKKIDALKDFEENTLIVVGALHLYGKDNLLELLECEVQPLCH